jgi:hypothetical protein
MADGTIDAAVVARNDRRVKPNFMGKIPPNLVTTFLSPESHNRQENVFSRILLYFCDPTFLRYQTPCFVANSGNKEFFSGLKQFPLILVYL